MLKSITGSLETHMLFPGAPTFTSWLRWNYGKGRGTLFSLSHSFIIFHPHYHCTRHKLGAITNVGHNVMFPLAFAFHPAPTWGWGFNAETWSQALLILAGKDPHLYSETVPLAGDSETTSGDICYLCEWEGECTKWTEKNSCLLQQRTENNANCTDKQPEHCSTVTWHYSWSKHQSVIILH